MVSSGIFQNIAVEKTGMWKSKKHGELAPALLGRRRLKIGMSLSMTTLSLFGVYLFLGTRFQENVAHKFVNHFCCSYGISWCKDLASITVPISAYQTGVGIVWNKPCSERHRNTDREIKSQLFQRHLSVEEYTSLAPAGLSNLPSIHSDKCPE